MLQCNLSTVLIFWTKHASNFNMHHMASTADNECYIDICVIIIIIVIIPSVL